MGFGNNNGWNNTHLLRCLIIALEHSRMVNGCTQCKLVGLGFPEIEIQEASLFNHIRDVINRFVRTGNVSKDN